MENLKVVVIENGNFKLVDDGSSFELWNKTLKKCLSEVPYDDEEDKLLKLISFTNLIAKLTVDKERYTPIEDYRNIIKKIWVNDVDPELDTFEIFRIYEKPEIYDKVFGDKKDLEFAGFNL